MEPKDDKSQQKLIKGYGKRPLWQWIVIYVFAFHHSTSGGGLKY
jgi:hypothetical protein